ncbi:MAG: pantoate--beta-alanine ligase [Fimbriimonadales bacterium]
MRVVRTVAEMASIEQADLGFVPTMGAFHEGHLSLMRAARKNHRIVCVSLFVNPLQFGRGEDLDKYPRDEPRDFALADQAGVDVMFVPRREDIFPRAGTTIQVPGLTQLWEGKSRPGHFEGVATVVAKLFNIVRPKAAYFGWKDLQQCVVIRRMVDDLNFPVRLSFHDTVREPDGLALSSRNAYLNPEERQKAPMLWRILSRIAGEVEHIQPIAAALSRGRADLAESGFDVDYLELVSVKDLSTVHDTSEAALIVGARLGTTRLIDNLRL